MKFSSKFIHFLSRISISKWRLENGVHFVSASIWYFPSVTETAMPTLWVTKAPHGNVRNTVLNNVASSSSSLLLVPCGYLSKKPIMRSVSNKKRLWEKYKKLLPDNDNYHRHLSWSEWSPSIITHLEITTHLAIYLISSCFRFRWEPAKISSQ